ncbi:unnamed protein product [Callosobruchus maculatus]|uniref:Uncharacterized protein n=1 Tax=Callosobruchus maculatus TaxID=64391 RepID=A0A653BUQ3_CALMS|nr:unnamed protein product [Callosobruchus maculatus]
MSLKLQLTAATTSTGRHEHDDESPCNAAVMGARHRRRCPPNPRDPPSRPPNATPWSKTDSLISSQIPTSLGFHRSYFSFFVNKYSRGVFVSNDAEAASPCGPDAPPQHHIPHVRVPTRVRRVVLPQRRHMLHHV